MSKQYDSPPPVKVGQVLEVDITSEGSEGDGFSRFNDFVIFVLGAKLGEKKLKVKVTEVKPRHGKAEKI